MFDKEDDICEMFDGYDEPLLDDPRTSYPPVPKKLISTLIKRGVISAPVTPEQDSALKFLQWAWADASNLVLRFMLSSIRKRDRAILVEYPQLGKIERYILTLYSGEKRRTVNEVKEIVFKTFGVNYPTDEIKSLRLLGYRKISAKKNNALGVTKS